MARRSSGASGGGDAEGRRPSRRRSGTQKPGAKGRSASPRSEGERKQAAAKRATARKRQAAAPGRPTRTQGSAQGKGAGDPPREAPASGGDPRRAARLRRPYELWGRRTVAVGGLLVAIAIIGGIIALIGGGGSSSSSGSSQQQSLADLQNKLLKSTVVVPPKGIQVRRPGSWKESKKNGVVSLRSHSGCLVMTLSAPGDANKAHGLLQDAVKVLRGSYSGAKVESAPASRIGGVPTTSRALSFRRNGHEVRVLLSVGKGDKYAYLTEVVARPECTVDLSLAQVVLSSIQYTK